MCALINKSMIQAAFLVAISLSSFLRLITFFLVFAKPFWVWLLTDWCCLCISISCCHLCWFSIVQLALPSSSWNERCLERLVIKWLPLSFGDGGRGTWADCLDYLLNLLCILAKSMLLSMSDLTDSRPGDPLQSDWNMSSEDLELSSITIVFGLPMILNVLDLVLN